MEPQFLISPLLTSYTLTAAYGTVMDMGEPTLGRLLSLARSARISVRRIGRLHMSGIGDRCR